MKPGLFKIICLAGALAAAAQTPAPDYSAVIIGKVDAKVKYNNATTGVSILVSQIGYSVEGRRLAFLYAKTKAAGDAVTQFTIVDSTTNTTLFTGTPSYFGTWEQGQFWKMDFSALKTVGRYRLVAGGLTSHVFPIKAWNDLFIKPYYVPMLFDQMDARIRNDANGGFQDCNTDWRETNSHSTSVMGMIDIYEQLPSLFSAQDVTRFKAFMDHYAAFYLGQQLTSGQIQGGWNEGEQLTKGKWCNHLMGLNAVLRLAKYYKSLDNTHYNSMLTCAQKAITWARNNFDPEWTGKWWDAELSQSNRLAQLQWDETLYHELTGDATALTQAKRRARELDSLQVKSSQATSNGIYGVFKQQNGALSRLNYHCCGQDGTEGPNNGEYWGTPLLGLVDLATLYPNDADAPLWKSVVTNYVNGFIKVGCGKSPFGLVPNGDYGGTAGVCWFSDIFHGMSMVYGLMGKSIAVYSGYLNDPSLLDLAQAQEMWIGGLNTGKDYPAAPSTFSCIKGVGYQWVRDGLDPGSGDTGFCCNPVSNGLSATPEFDKRMPTGPETPTYVCVESWIAHSAGWLMAATALSKAYSTATVIPPRMGRENENAAEMPRMRPMLDGRRLMVTSAAPTRVDLVDSRGRVVRSAVAEGETVLELNGLAQGTYLVTVRSGSCTSVNRVIVH